VPFSLTLKDGLRRPFRDPASKRKYTSFLETQKPGQPTTGLLLSTLGRHSPAIVEINRSFLPFAVGSPGFATWMPTMWKTVATPSATVAVRADCGSLRFYTLPWPQRMPLPCTLTLLKILETRATVVATLDET
jgi:hypothetical protein